MNSLDMIDNERARVPFNYDGQILGSLREDQIPRFFGALTDPESLPVTKFPFASLTAMQDRVSVPKVEAIRASSDKTGKKPLVVINNGKTYLADGHHRAVARWLDGEDSIDAHWKDITEQNNTVKVAKVDESLGLVFGWAIISKLRGADYFDTQGDCIPENVMLKGAAEFMMGDRVAKEMHVGPAKGRVVFAWPMTEDIAKSMGVRTDQTGLMIAIKPDTPDTLEKFRNGTYTGFSIGGKGERITAV